MTTRVLRAIQQPSQVDQLLQELVQCLRVVPKDAFLMLDRSELPVALQRIVASASAAGQSWACWADDSNQHWFFVAELSVALSRERGAPVLQVDQYREDGDLKEASNWLHHPTAWQRCSG